MPAGVNSTSRLRTAALYWVRRVRWNAPISEPSSAPTRMLLGQPLGEANVRGVGAIERDEPGISLDHSVPAWRLGCRAPHGYSECSRGSGRGRGRAVQRSSPTPERTSTSTDHGCSPGGGAGSISATTVTRSKRDRGQARCDRGAALRVDDGVGDRDRVAAGRHEAPQDRKADGDVSNVLGHRGQRQDLLALEKRYEVELHHLADGQRDVVAGEPDADEPKQIVGSGAGCDVRNQPNDGPLRLGGLHDEPLHRARPHQQLFVSRAVLDLDDLGFMRPHCLNRGERLVGESCGAGRTERAARPVMIPAGTRHDPRGRCELLSEKGLAERGTDADVLGVAS